MERKQDRFRMEAAGSLTPALEGAPHSAEHLRNTKEKGRGSADEALSLIHISEPTRPY